MFSKKLYSLLTALSLLLSGVDAYAAPGGDLNLTNKASLVSRTGYGLTLGTESASNPITFRQGNATTLTLNGTSGLVLSGAVQLPNNTWLNALSAAVTELNVLRVNTSNATQLNTASSTSMLFSVDGTSQWTLSSSSLSPLTTAAEDIGSLTVGVNNIFTGGVQGTTGGNLDIRARNGQVDIYTIGSDATPVRVWRFGTTGNFTQDATNGGDIQISKAGTTLTLPVDSALTATGTTITDALQLTKTYSQITTVAAGSGVKLPALSIGAMVVVKNRGANALLVYPPNDAASFFDAAAVGASVSVAVGASVVCVKTSATQWFTFEAAAA